MSASGGVCILARAPLFNKSPWEPPRGRDGNYMYRGYVRNVWDSIGPVANSECRRMCAMYVAALHVCITHVYGLVGTGRACLVILRTIKTFQNPTK